MARGRGGWCRVRHYPSFFSLSLPPFGASRGGRGTGWSSKIKLPTRNGRGQSPRSRQPSNHKVPVLAWEMPPDLFPRHHHHISSHTCPMTSPSPPVSGRPYERSSPRLVLSGPPVPPDCFPRGFPSGKHGLPGGRPVASPLPFSATHTPPTLAAARKETRRRNCGNRAPGHARLDRGQRPPR